MINQQLVSAALLNAFPFLCILAFWCFKRLEHWLPSKQQATLAVFVQQAVTMVEQLYGASGPIEKKNLAIQATIELFRAFHLPIPPLSALNTAIEATVYAVHQSSQTLTAQPVVATPKTAQMLQTPQVLQTLQRPQEPAPDMDATAQMAAVRPQFRPVTLKGNNGNAAQ